MKRFALALVAALTLSISSYAAPESVMLKIKDDLKENFSRPVNITYTESEEWIRASFEQDGAQLHVYYDLDGNLVGKARFVKLNELPERAQAELTKKYADAKVEVAFVYEQPNTDPVYYLSLSEGNSRFMLSTDRRGHLSFHKRL